MASSSSSGTSGAAQSVLVNHLNGNRIVSVPSLVRRVPLRAPTPSVPTPPSSEDEARDFYPDSRASGDFYEESGTPPDSGDDTLRPVYEDSSVGEDARAFRLATEGDSA